MTSAIAMVALTGVLCLPGGGAAVAGASSRLVLAETTTSTVPTSTSTVAPTTSTTEPSSTTTIATTTTTPPTTTTTTIAVPTTSSSTNAWIWLIIAAIVIGVVILLVVMSGRRRAAAARDAQARQLVESAGSLAETAGKYPALSDPDALDLWSTLMDTQNAAVVASLAALGEGGDEIQTAAIAAVTGSRERLAQSVNSYLALRQISPPVSQEQVSFATDAIRVHSAELHEATTALRTAIEPPSAP